MRLHKRLYTKKLRLKLWLALDEVNFAWYMLAKKDEENTK